MYKGGKGGTRAFSRLGRAGLACQKVLPVPGEAGLERIVVLPGEELHGYRPKTHGTPRAYGSPEQGGWWGMLEAAGSPGPSGQSRPLTEPPPPVNQELANAISAQRVQIRIPPPTPKSYLNVTLLNSFG